MEVIQEFITLNKERRLRIAVLGDSMRDEYKYGTVDRVSPEFPVPILTSQDNNGEQCPGGAANVCLQMKHFNVDVFLISLIDKESCDLFKKQNFNISYCVNLNIGKNPHKIRFYDNNFPLHRWDIESYNYGENEETLNILRKKVLENFGVLISQGIDAVILSDYNKGFWTDELAQAIISKCREKGIISVVDPKKVLDRWYGCTIFKPNAKEARELSGKLNIEEQMCYIQNRIECDAIVITQNGNGVVGQFKKKSNIIESIEWVSPSKDVNSTIGAGDCFVAILTVASTHGFDLKKSSMLAFEGGVQYVKARHNKPITPHDIHSRFDAPSAKVLTIDELVYLKDNLYLEDEFVFTNGCFDILHIGHLNTLKFAKSKGGKLVVGLNSDNSVSALKGPGRPIRSFEERAALMAAIEYVDFVVCFDEPTPEEIIKKLKPHYIVKGGDYNKDDVVGLEHVKEVFIAPTVEGYSTTRFLQNLSTTPYIIT